MTELAYTTPTGTVIDLTTSDGLRDMRIEIAKRLGYRLEQEDVAWYVWQPDGTRHYATHAKTATDERSAWKSYLGGAWRHFPDWPTDVNSALELWVSVALYRLVWLERDYATGWNAGFITSSKHAPQPISDGWHPCINAATPALAICLAWLFYKDAENQP